MNVNLKNLREKLSKEFMLEGLPEEKKEEILSIIVETVFKKFLLVIAEHISHTNKEDQEFLDSIFCDDSKLTELYKFIDGGPMRIDSLAGETELYWSQMDRDKLIKFEKIMKIIAPDPDSIISEIVSNLRDEIKKPLSRQRHQRADIDTTSMADDGEAITTVGDHPYGSGFHREGGNHEDDALTSSTMNWPLIEDEAEFLKDGTVRGLLAGSGIQFEHLQAKTGIRRDPTDRTAKRTVWSWIRRCFSGIFWRK